MNDGCKAKCLCLVLYVEQLCVNDGCEIMYVAGPLRGAAVCERRL